MTQINPAQFAQSYLSGASLGTQQFGQLASIASNRAAMEQRNREFEADQQYRQWQQGMAEDRFALDESRHSLDIAEYEQRALEEFTQQQQAMEERERTRLAAKALGDVYLAQFGRAKKPQQMPAQGDGVPDLAAQRQQQRQTAMDMEDAYRPNPMQGQDGARRAMTGGKPAFFDPEPQDDPFDQRFIDSMGIAVAAGDISTVKELGKVAGDVEKRRAAMKKGEVMWKTLGPRIEQIINPTEKALAMAAMQSEEYADVVSILKSDESKGMEEGRKVAALMGINPKLTPDMAVNLVRLGLADDAAKKASGLGADRASGVDAAGVAGIYEKSAAAALRTPAGAKIKPDQRSLHARLMEAAATARANPASVLPDGRVVMNGGRPGSDGFVRIANPDGSEDAVSPAEFAAIAAPAALAASQTEQTAQLTTEQEAMVDKMLDEGRTPEEIAAALSGAQ